MRKSILFILIIFFFFSTLFSANVEMYLNKNVLYPTDTLNLTIIVKGYGLEDCGRVSFPDIPGFIKVDNRETELPTIVGGKQFILRKYIFSYIPTKSGIFYIPPISIKLPDGVYKSKKIEIKVLNPDGTENKTVYLPPERNVEKPVTKRSEIRLKDEIKLVREMDTKNPYEGEQVVLTYKILTRKSINQNVIQKVIPEYGDFWVEDITREIEHSYQTVILDGKKYYSVILQKLVLFPIKSGKLKIGESKWEVKIKDINPPFKETPKLLSVASIEIDVKPLPTKNVPKNFKGDVGDYEIKLNFGSKKLEVGKTTSLYLTVKGAGNVSAITCPEIPKSEFFKVVDVKAIHWRFGFYPFKHYGERLLYGGEKVWQIFFYPLREGKLKFPTIRFSFFNPFKGDYEEIVTDPVVFDVVRGNFNLVNKEIVGKKNTIQRKGGLSPKILLLVGVAFFSILLSFIIFVKVREKIKGRGIPSEVKREMKINLLFEDAWKNIERYRTRSFFEVVYTLTNEIVAYFVGIGIKGMTRGEIRDLLLRYGFMNRDVEKILDVLQLCDVVRFSNRDVEGEERKEVLKSLEEIWNEYKFRFGVKK